MLESVKEILSATKTGEEEEDSASSCSDDYVLRDEEEIAAEEAKAAAAKIHLGSLFRIKLLLDNGGHDLVYDPAPSDYQVRPPSSGSINV